MKTAEYSGTPLARKLGIKEKCRLRVINQPPRYPELLGDLPPGVRFVKDGRTKNDVIHYFAENAAGLGKEIKRLKDEMEVNGALWISWPKKSSGRQTDLDENLMRERGPEGRPCGREGVCNRRGVVRPEIGHTSEGPRRNVGKKCEEMMLPGGIAQRMGG